MLGLGLLGGFGRILQKHCGASISALEYFGEVDGHAMQYSLIAKCLLTTALEHLEKREAQERARRTESSAQLFGLVPRPLQGTTQASVPELLLDEERTRLLTPEKDAGNSDGAHPFEGRSPHFSLNFEADMFDLTESMSMTPEFSIPTGAFDVDGDPTLGSMNLFPLLENTEGHIDLANYF